jgi:hypothetical protein
MINQIANVKTKTKPLPVITPHLFDTRTQPLMKERAVTGSIPTEGYLWSPVHTGPFLVPVTRWIE